MYTKKYSTYPIPYVFRLINKLNYILCYKFHNAGRTIRRFIYAQAFLMNSMIMYCIQNVSKYVCPCDCLIS